MRLYGYIAEKGFAVVEADGDKIHTVRSVIITRQAGCINAVAALIEVIIYGWSFTYKFVYYPIKRSN